MVFFKIILLHFAVAVIKDRKEVENTTSTTTTSTATTTTTTTTTTTATPVSLDSLFSALDVPKKKFSSFLDRSTRVSAAISLENYSHWTIHNLGHFRVSGRLTSDSGNLNPGSASFISAKKKWGLYGAQIQLKYFFDPCEATSNDVDLTVCSKNDLSYLDIMFDLPYNFNFYSNVLATMLCKKTGEKNLCPRDVDSLATGPGYMLYHNHNRLSRKIFKKKKEAFLNEDDHLILRASMTPEHNSIIKIQIFPKKYHALDTKIIRKISSEDYFEFLESLKQVDGPEETTQKPKRTTRATMSQSEMPRSRLGK
ncbi:Oidioi.mRNA.OKI2018_I69.chr2.g7767.t1.cds [Oikopleura dioica]|uniref:Oidioi.mRNA.OKI2018_I69.chr2.g7767.t1.cds n=1 Tax=Oikopleura dioica TaxID=34765 RepID=A0ABN7TE01_OIKDI|nr:Oidioi.mRNA.OKI2018_I69.chr2.g7767.t1.cds [Oikopleura dioica]